MKTKTPMLAGAVTALIMVASHAATISVNVGFNGTLASTDVVGVVPAANWNEISATNNNPSSSSLINDSGTPVTGMSVSFMGNQNTYNNDGSNNPTQRMFSGFLNGGTMAVDLSNIPYDAYDVYIYYSGFIPNQSLTWVASDITGAPIVVDTQYSVRGTGVAFDIYNTYGFVQSQYSTLAAANSDAALPVLGGNYLKFSGLTADNLRIAETSRNGFGEIGFAGIQVVQVPEPSILGLLALAPALAFRRRRA